MHALALGAEERQILHGVRAGVTEPVWYPSVELGRLAGSQHEVVLAEYEPEPPAEDVEPLVTFVGPGVGYVGRLPGRDHVFEGLEAARSAAERVDGHPVAGDRAWMNARIAGRHRPDELVEGDLMRSGKRRSETVIGHGAETELPGVARIVG
jgi:hypothetical protein